MRNILLVVGVAGLVGLFSACGGTDHAHTLPDSTGGKPSMGGRSTTGGKSSGGKNTGGTSSLGGADDSPGGAPDSPIAPAVEITSPVESATPDDGVLSGTIVHVVCTVIKSSAPGAAAIDPTSVTISLTDSTGKPGESKNAAATANADEYSADLILTTVPPGKTSLTCSATDKNQVKGSDSVSTFVDHGPTITVISPTRESAHPLKGGLDVQFTVEPTSLAKNDAGADVDQVVFTLDGKEVDVEETSPGHFQTSLALDDPDQFPVIPGGAITITASNKRTPDPVTASVSYNITIDGAGPLINIESPAPQAVLGGKVTLIFNITDKGSGVDEKSVSVQLYVNQKPITYDPNNGWSRNGDKFTYTFDTTAIEPFAPVQTTINILASDKVGNPSGTGQSLQLYFDNVPPQIDLDPLNIRIRDNDGVFCSNSFDPVGPEAINDLDGSFGLPTLYEIGYFRVFVHERTNSQLGQKLFYHSGTNQGQVRLYIQAEPETATTKLLVNKNPGTDDTCDDIGGIDAMGNGPPFSALHPINVNSAAGGLWYQDDPAKLPLADGVCQLRTAPTPPDHLCPNHNSDMWYAPFFTEIKEPMVYVVGTPGNDASCAGIDLAFVNQGQKEGWVCAAARVVDNAGNIGISPPMRFCADDGVDPKPDCAISSTTPPTCTDGCTPPARGGGYIWRP
jgi:hypothetical protein